MSLTQEKVIEIIESVFRQKKGSVELTTSLEKVAKDSMDVVEFIAILKNKYNIVIEPTEVSKLSNVKDVVEYVLKHQQAKD